MRTKEEALEVFTYHAPKPGDGQKFKTVTAGFITLVDTLWDLLPDGPGKTLVFRDLQIARMRANACIALEGK
ncbi:MAG TPA: hypothetical protein VIW64_16150 [Pyrinomonadaceae bacterium]|jgi:hypothetical protein